MNKLTHTEGRIIVAIDHDKKNWHQFEDGTKIRLERKYDNFNMRYVNPVNAIVVSAENIPEGAEILIHHNSIHDTNRVFDHNQLSGKNEASEIKYYSLKEDEAFAWRADTGWNPLPGYDFALRIFKPYIGILEGIEPTEIKNHLYLLTGDHKEKVGITIKYCDYEIIFQDLSGREGNLIRIRTNGDDSREPEVIAIHNGYTQQVKNGDLLVGLNKNDAKTLKQQYDNSTTKRANSIFAR